MKYNVGDMVQATYIGHKDLIVIGKIEDIKKNLYMEGVTVVYLEGDVSREYHTGQWKIEVLEDYDDSNLIGIDETRELLREIVSSKPRDFRYKYETDSTGTEITSCAYTTTDAAPSCIVGHVMDSVAPDILTECYNKEWDDEGNFLNSRAAYTVRELWDVFTPHAMILLDRVQKNQDGGVPWSEINIDQEWNGVTWR